jgi:hypothetical protein
MCTALSDRENGELLVTEEFCRNILNNPRVFNKHEGISGKHLEQTKEGISAPTRNWLNLKS